jgi:hypothetical protein
MVQTMIVVRVRPYIGHAHGTVHRHGPICSSCHHLTFFYKISAPISADMPVDPPAAMVPRTASHSSALVTVVLLGVVSVGNALDMLDCWHLGNEGESCNTVCEQLGGTCNQAALRSVTDRCALQAINAATAGTCTTFISGNAQFNPSHYSSGNCYGELPSVSFAPRSPTIVRAQCRCNAFVAPLTVLVLGGLCRVQFRGLRCYLRKDLRGSAVLCV